MSTLISQTSWALRNVILKRSWNVVNPVFSFQVINTEIEEKSGSRRKSKKQEKEGTEETFMPLDVFSLHFAPGQNVLRISRRRKFSVWSPLTAIDLCFLYWCPHVGGLSLCSSCDTSLQGLVALLGWLKPQIRRLLGQSWLVAFPDDQDRQLTMSENVYFHLWLGKIFAQILAFSPYLCGFFPIPGYTKSMTLGLLIPYMSMAVDFMTKSHGPRIITCPKSQMESLDTSKLPNSWHLSL